MANQPKKYKKFVATAATATLVASAIVPVASAASFSDVVVGGSHSEAINALADQGIIKGYADGTFKPGVQINRGQTVKLLGRWLESQGYEIPADWNSVQRFSDVPVNAADQELVKYAALVKDAGVFNGSQGKLNASQPMQRQHMAVVLVRAIKNVLGEDLVQQYKDAGFVSSIEDLDQAYANENREAIIALEFAGITKVSDGNFRPTQTVTRGQFASFLYRTINLDVINAEVESIKAINNTTVEVTFKDAVNHVNAADFTIDGLDVLSATIKQTDNKTVVLKTSAQEGGKSYIVSYEGKKLGQFNGVSAVLPTKVEFVEESVQAITGQEVTVKAKVTVPEGQSKAGIPVTFYVQGITNDAVTPTLTAEVLTDENGVATYSYTRYKATSTKGEEVTAYATGNRAVFATSYVFWGVDKILDIQEVTEGSTINNGGNKTYKVTYKDPDTGKPVSNATLKVSFLENINTTVDKVSKATVNGVNPVQYSNGSTPVAAQIVTDKDGVATFTVSGRNTEVTPIVFVNNTSDKYEANYLQAKASKVKFAAVQAEYTIEITRDGGEVAAIGYENGRKYKLVVKDKNGNPAKNEVVNVAFNEDLDRVINTETRAKFVKLNSDGDPVSYYNSTPDADGNSDKQISVKTNANGEATFVVSSDTIGDYVTPIAWIDINSSDARNGVLDEGEPKSTGPISYFEAAKLSGGKLVSQDTSGNSKSAFRGTDTAQFVFQLTNQSGKKINLSQTGYNSISATFTVTNTGSNDVEVIANGTPYTVSPNRDLTVTVNGLNPLINVKPKDSTKNAAVSVTATGVVSDSTNSLKPFTISSTDSVKVQFTGTAVVGNLEKGIVSSFDTDKKTITITGKDPIKYAGETGKTYNYKTDTGLPLSLENFENVLKNPTGAVELTYEVKDDVVTLWVKDTGTGKKPIDTIAEDQTSVTNAKAKFTNPSPVVKVAGGSDGTDADKLEAVKAYAVATANDATVTVDVQKTATNTYTVTLSKGKATDTVTLIPTFEKASIDPSNVQAQVDENGDDLKLTFSSSLSGFVLDTTSITPSTATDTLVDVAGTGNVVTITKDTNAADKAKDLKEKVLVFTVKVDATDYATTTLTVEVVIDSAGKRSVNIK